MSRSCIHDQIRSIPVECGIILEIALEGSRSMGGGRPGLGVTRVLGYRAGKGS